jgi:alpha-galactosidase
MRYHTKYQKGEKTMKVTKVSRQTLFALTFALLLNPASGINADTPDHSAYIRTPPKQATPRINGPNVFGVRPNSPFLYTIPATGDRPLKFSVKKLPRGLSIDAVTGRITGSLATPGEYKVILRAKNAKGTAEKKFRIVVGEKIALTPPMGWNSWNCWAWVVDQEKVLRSARALVSSGLINHGWAYINVDDTWQGKRTGKNLALQPNERFPDMKALYDQIHAFGLKAGIYSSPWITTFAGYQGGSCDDMQGGWTRLDNYESNKRIGKYSFTEADAAQFGEWGIDYLKYDWAPNDVEHTQEMADALRKTGRDIVYSLSCGAAFDLAADYARLANCWRVTGDIGDAWGQPTEPWKHGIAELAFSQDRWAPYAGPGHWNDPDMLEIGYVGGGPNLHLTHLTPDEQYTHITMWCLLSAPLLIGCDLERLDPFTLSLLTNDEVLALDQDALGKQAVRAATVGGVVVYMKELEDGSRALGFFNPDTTAHSIEFKAFNTLGIKSRQRVRDLWRQVNLPDIEEPSKDALKITIPAHGVELYKLTAAANPRAAQEQQAHPVEPAAVTGPYFGQTPPGETPKLFAPGILTQPSGVVAVTRIAFSADGNECFFSGPTDWNFSNTRMYYTKRVNNVWTPHVPASFFPGYSCRQPYFSADGNTLYFSSNKNGASDIWMVVRTSEGWGTPQVLPVPINTTSSYEGMYTQTTDGTAYIESDRPGGLGKFDVWRISPPRPGQPRQVENLGPAVNSSSDDNDPIVSPDGSYLIFGSNYNDLFVTFNKGDGGWTAPVDLNQYYPGINTNDQEYAPSISPDGRYLFFTRIAGGGVFWVENPFNTNQTIPIQ